MSTHEIRLPKDVRLAIDTTNEHVLPLPHKERLDTRYTDPSVTVGDLERGTFKLATIRLNYPEGFRVEIVYEAHEDGTRRLHSVKSRQGKKNRNFHETNPEIKNSPSWS